jgi:hypothetical protein
MVETALQRAREKETQKKMTGTSSWVKEQVSLIVSFRFKNVQEFF